MCRIKRIITIADRVAKNAEYHYRLGAVVVKGGKVLSVGHNNLNGHAECNALKQSPKTIGADLFVSRITTTGHAMSKPCNSCMAEIENAGIKRIFYTTRNGIEKVIL